MTFAFTKWIITLPDTVITGPSGSPPASKMELFVTIIYSWRHLTTVSKRSILDIVNMIFTITVETVSVMNSFWIELDGFCQPKNNFTKPEPLPTSKMEPFVTIFDSWKLLTSVASSQDPFWLNYGFQRTEEGCSNVNSLVEYVDNEIPIFVFVSSPKCNHDSNETILETISMSEKALKMLLNIFGNVNAAARPAWGQPSILK